MDRPIARTPWWRKRSTAFAAAGAAAAALLYSLALPGTAKSVRVEGSQVEVARVARRPFREAVSVPGTVQPTRTIFLAAADGGRVEEIVVREGSSVESGELLLRLSNPSIELELQRREDELQRAVDALGTTRLEVEESRQRAQRDLLEIEHTLLVRQKDLDVQRELQEEELTPYREFERARDEVDFWERRLALFREAEERAERFRATQIEQAEESLKRRGRSYETAKERSAALHIRAPGAGRLSALAAELGESKAAGDRLGQIDAGGFRVEGEIDQIFASRVERGLEGVVDLDDGAGTRSFAVRVERIYAEVIGGKFKVDLAFDATPPESLKRGQRLVTRLFLSDQNEALVVPKGPFFQRTGGRWVFVVADGGRRAARREIRLGRQDVDGYEVLSGLEVGEAVITSRYDGFGDAERLILEP